MTSAGDKVSDSVSSRYGDSTMYKAIFSERKLVHSACLFAFTGTWDFDVTAILEEDISIDIESIATVYPCTRRFVSFNPSTNPSGLTTYNYHLGVGLIAGSNVKYEVQLICSDDYSCDTPTGKCDCVDIRGDPRTLPIGPGYADRGQVIDEEYFENTINTPYRYDKVILKWESKDSDKHGEAECKIKEAGGKAPTFCSIDVAEGAYRCSLGFESNDYARFYQKPTAGKSRFTREEAITANIKISQRQPSGIEAGSEFNPYTKFLYMRLYNHKNFLLDEFGPYPLNGNGIHDFRDLPNYIIKKEDFAKGVPHLRPISGPIKVVNFDEKDPPDVGEYKIEFTDEVFYKVTSGLYSW